MAQIDAELKKVLSRIKKTQTQFHKRMKARDWVSDARRFADQQKKEFRKVVRKDVSKLRKYMVKERKELDRFQKQIPREIGRIKKYVQVQRKELDRFLKALRTNAESFRTSPKKRSAAKKRKTTSKRTTRKKTKKA